MASQQRVLFTTMEVASKLATLYICTATGQTFFPAIFDTIHDFLGKKKVHYGAQSDKFENKGSILNLHANNDLKYAWASVLGDKDI